MKAGQEAAKVLLKEKWKWHSSPGNGKTNSVFCCNAHVACNFLVRVVKVAEETYVLQSTGEHTVQLKEQRRSNSALKYDVEIELRNDVDKGIKPGGFHSALLKRASDSLKAMGEEPLQHKLPEGGLPGELSKQRCSSADVSE